MVVAHVDRFCAVLVPRGDGGRVGQSLFKGRDGKWRRVGAFVSGAASGVCWAGCSRARPKRVLRGVRG